MYSSTGNAYRGRLTPQQARFIALLGVAIATLNIGPHRIESGLIIQRTAVRALLLAEPDQLLLSRIFIPDRQMYIWITPGGGVNPGERPVEALVREVKEETNHEVESWIGPVWFRRHQFQFRGDTYDQEESFFLVRTQKFKPDHIGNLGEIEHELFDQFRWWSLGDIRRSEETFVPKELASHLESLIELGTPRVPIEVGT